MCGVLGIVGSQPVVDRLIAGASRLQNRGEQSTRVVTFDGNYFHDHGGLGPASLLFFQRDSSDLVGNSGIAHTRYSTSGKSNKQMLLRNIQPVFSERPGMATCSNGDLVNLVSITNKLKKRGFSFQTEVDAKVIQYSLVDRFNKNKLHNADNREQYVQRLFKSVEEVQETLVGAYSCLSLTDRGLLAFKDVNGIRPLCMACRYDYSGRPIEWAFASETSVFNYFGDYHQIQEIKAGEAVFVEIDTLKVHRIESARAKPAFCFFEYVYFSRPDSRYNGHVVEVVRQRLGEVLARENSELRERLDTVVGLPGTAISTGHSFARAMGLPIKRAIIKVDNKRSFQETSIEKRRRAIDDKFIFIRDFIEGRSLAVVDDSNVRGTTGRKIVARLFDLGAREVHMFYYSPPIIGPCYYGIDTPDETQLIASGKTIEQVRAEMGCTSVNYISRSGLIEGLGQAENELCLACIARKYPTDVAEAQQRLERRKLERE
ncbi:MAG: amidophosphoribosyltransferase [Candidatus Alcyoniella australis]|nr:amidophosphoribosyltransferase [Candidatus Alcyoniella australis]